MDKEMNKSIACTVTDCKNHCKNGDFCSLNKIEIEAKREVDAGISRENQAAKQSGERQAERNRENIDTNDDIDSWL